MEVLPVAPDEAAAVAETIALAFQTDPVWGPALESPDGATDHLRLYWRFYVDGARRYDTVFTTAGAGTVSVWIPPGGTEVTEEQEAGMRELARAALGPERVAALFDLWERFETNHPHEQPHAYLSLLARRPDLGGHGHGQAHLTAVLEHWDAAGLPSYLESTNPGNDHRYARQGYRPVGHFDAPLNGAVVTTMWRPVGG